MNHCGTFGQEKIETIKLLQKNRKKKIEIDILQLFGNSALPRALIVSFLPRFEMILVLPAVQHHILRNQNSAVDRFYKESFRSSKK